jgi:hypothetical protein
MLKLSRTRAILLVVLFAFSFAFAAAYEMAAADIACNCGCVYWCGAAGGLRPGTRSPNCYTSPCAADASCYLCRVN